MSESSAGVFKEPEEGVIGLFTGLSLSIYLCFYLADHFLEGVDHSLLIALPLTSLLLNLLFQPLS